MLLIFLYTDKEALQVGEASYEEALPSDGRVIPGNGAQEGS